MIETILDSIRDPSSISAPIAIGAICYFIGMALKKSPIADWMIPWILLPIGGIGYLFFGDPSAVYPAVPRARLFMFGVLYAGAAVFADQLKSQLMNRPKKDNGGTEFITKPSEKEKNT